MDVARPVTRRGVRSGTGMICRKFEWWFKRRDESLVNPRAHKRGDAQNPPESPLILRGERLLTLRL
jgi:hypothetical protein